MLDVKLQRRLDKAFEGNFMKPVIEYGTVYAVETDSGESFTLPAEVLPLTDTLKEAYSRHHKEIGPMILEKGWDLERTARGDKVNHQHVDGFLSLLEDYIPESVCTCNVATAQVFDAFYGRASASGYNDCTEWVEAKTLEQLVQCLIQDFGNEEEADRAHYIVYTHDERGEMRLSVDNEDGETVYEVSNQTEGYAIQFIDKHTGETELASYSVDTEADALDEFKGDYGPDVEVLHVEQTTLHIPFAPFEDGYMKSMSDIEGLQEYLITIGLVEYDAKLMFP